MTGRALAMVARSLGARLAETLQRQSATIAAMTYPGHPSRPMPQILVLGRDTCEDTLQSRMFLTRQKVPFQYLSWEHDAETEEAIRGFNNGDVVTPTIVIGDPDNPSQVLVEPSDEELDRAITEAGGGL